MEKNHIACVYHWAKWYGLHHSTYLENGSTSSGRKHSKNRTFPRIDSYILKLIVGCQPTETRRAWYPVSLVYPQHPKRKRETKVWHSPPLWNIASFNRLCPITCCLLATVHFQAPTYTVVLNSYVSVIIVWLCFISIIVVWEINFCPFFASNFKPGIRIGYRAVQRRNQDTNGGAWFKEHNV